MFIFTGTWLHGESFADRYSSYGHLILTNLPSAPFPHTNRVQGYSYGHEFFPAEKNYSDSTVAIFIPKDLKPASKVDFVIHFHGWRNSVTNVLRHYELIDQLAASGRKAILVVPQGPLNAADSFGGKLEDIGGFDRFMNDVLDVVHHETKFTKAQPRTIILSGHSGGYHVISAIVGQTNQFPVNEVWLFDALYGQTEKFTGWFERNPKARLMDIYTENGGTKKETENLMANLRAKKTPFLSGGDQSLSEEAVRKNRLVFIYTNLAHDEVMQKRKMFQTFVETSGLRR